MVLTYAGARYKRKTRANYMLGRLSRNIASNARRSFGKFRRFGLANNVNYKASGRPRNLTVQNPSLGVKWWPRIGRSPMPTMQNRQLKWTSERLTVSSAVGGICGTAHDYNLNGLYQISTAGGANVQPMGFDEMMHFYNSYRVYKVEIKIRFGQPSGGFNAAAGIAQIRASNDNTTNGAIAGRTWQELNQRSNVATMIVSDTEDNENTIYRTLYISQIEGQSIVDNNYTGRYDLNPTNKPLLKIGCCDIDGNDTNSIKYHVEFIFHTTFFDKKSLELS